MKKGKTTSVYFPEDVWKRVCDISKNTGYSISNLVCRQFPEFPEPGYDKGGSLDILAEDPEYSNALYDRLSRIEEKLDLLIPKGMPASLESGRKVLTAADEIIQATKEKVKAEHRAISEDLTDADLRAANERLKEKREGRDPKKDNKPDFLKVRKTYEDNKIYFNIPKKMSLSKWHIVRSAMLNAGYHQTSGNDGCDHCGVIDGHWGSCPKGSK
jgi:hypothetical protein